MFNFSDVKRGCGKLVQRIPNVEHMTRAVEARKFLRDSDPDNVRVVR